jgi:anhydro-N-acetylmuramic acid kinase
VTQHLNQLPQSISNEDVQATLSELTAQSVVDAIHRYARNTIEVFICGGGMNNSHLISRLKSLNDAIEWKSTAESGIMPENMEAVAFAWFAKQTIEKKPLKLTTITGGKHSRIAGAIYPGKHYN